VQAENGLSPCLIASLTRFVRTASPLRTTNVPLSVITL
jgi:hypothetical protein